MCGIVGFISKNKDKKKIIKDMADRLIHRGPDGDGYYVDDNASLGHRRLAIIDLKGGIQPMSNEDDNLIITFNGEIYNYQELKKELKKHKFKTNCDTEVLLHGYEEWGEDLPNHLRGMWSFAIWDKNKKELFCSRDYFGIKPFYYYESKENSFMFASEIKAFLSNPEFEKEFNKDILMAYLTFSFNPTNETFFKGVKELPAGSNLIYKDGSVEIKKYFEFKLGENTNKYTIDEMEEVIKDSIKHHFISDVNVGSFLSSGVDSSYVVSLSNPYKTYTLGYNTEEFSEIDRAAKLANYLGLDHAYKKLEKDEYIKNLPKILYYMDAPITDPAAISLYFLAGLAVKDVKVVLSGEGADEFFGGYNTYKMMYDSKIYEAIPYFIRHGIAKILELTPEFKGRNFLVRNGYKIEDFYIGVSRLFEDRECERLLSYNNTLNNKDITKKIYDKYKDYDDLTKMQAIDINFWLTKDILYKADRMSMANSLEARVPFVDIKVFDMAKDIKSSEKVSKNGTKLIFRRLADRSIPSEVASKKKLGFPVPLREWMHDEDLYVEMKNTFEKPWVKEFFNQKRILKLLDRIRKNNYKKVWAIYIFLKWYEIYFIKEI